MVKKPNVAAGSGVVIVDSSIVTGGGDIVGRDKHVQYRLAAELDDIFQPISELIDAADSRDRASAKEQLQALKDETRKGKDANDSIVAKLVEGIVGLVPTALTAVVSAFATPVLGAVVGPVTKYVLEKIQGK
jgi:hypothetical protein